MLDRYLWGSVNRISPEAPVPVVNIENTTVTLGGAANVAANIVGFGGHSILTGVCGSDSEAAVLGQLLNQADIENCLSTIEGRPTTVKTRLVAHSQQVVRFDQETSAVLSDAQNEKLTADVLSALDRVSAVVISDYAKGVVSPKTLVSLLSAAKKGSVPVLIDPKGKDYSKYRGATILTPNRREASDAAKLDESDPELIAHSAKYLLAECDLEAVLITQGEKGMTLFEAGGETHYLEAHSREVYDVTGAGDTVIAAMAVALGAGATLVEAARIANVAAGLAVEEVGTAVISKAALAERLSAHD